MGSLHYYMSPEDNAALRARGTKSTELQFGGLQDKWCLVKLPAKRKKAAAIRRV
jgi:hypothetical protein